MYNYFNAKEHLKPEEVIMYLRKSRADDPLLSVEEVLAKHETLLDEWVEKNLSAPIPPENKFKEVVSGESIADRPAFQRVLQLIEQPNYKAVLVVEISRLGRPDTMEIGKISKTFRFTKSIVITPMRIFDIADEYDRDMFEQELKRGNFYLEYTKKLLSRGRELSVKQGNYIAGKPVYGYDKAVIIEDKRKCPTLAINEEQANVVRMIFDWYVNENIGTQTIAKRLNALNIKSPIGQIWKPDSIRGIVDNVHYIGLVRWNNRKGMLIVDNGEFRKTRPKTAKEEVIIAKGRHEAIISEELFKQAQEKRGRTHRTSDNKELKNPLASILYCECGKAMSYRKSNQGKNKELPAVLVCNNQVNCGNGSVRVEEMIKFVADTLRNKIAEFKMEVKNADNTSNKLHEKMIKNLEKKLADINARELSLWESQVDPDHANRMPSHIFQTLTNKLVTEREETETALAKARETITNTIDYEKKIVTFQKALDALLDENMSVVEKNHLLKQCILRINYHRDKPTRLTGEGTNRQWTQPQVDLDVKFMV